MLRRILGLGFGLAMVFGGTVGVGILRLPGTLAAALGDSKLIVFFWILGGVYALLGAVSVAELAAMLPQAGGFYVYARRAFGNGVGFAVGWSRLDQQRRDPRLCADHGDGVPRRAVAVRGAVTRSSAPCSSSPRSRRCTGWAFLG